MDITSREEIKALEKELIKLYGEGYYPITQPRRAVVVDFIKTGCFSLDTVLQGGIPVGRLIEVWGKNSCFKSTICLYMAAECQRQGKVVAWLDFECAFTDAYAEQLGVDVSKLMLLSGVKVSGEKGIDLVKQLVNSGAVDIVFMDSVSCLIPERLEEAGVGEVSPMGQMARYWSSFLPGIVGALGQHKCSLVVINQTRANLSSYGGGEQPTGGGAIQFYKSVSIKTRKVEEIKRGTDVVGVKIELQSTKNKVGIPLLRRELSFYFGRGIDVVSDIVDSANELKLIPVKAGGNYTWKETKIKGRDKLVEYFRNNPDELIELRSILENYDYSKEASSQEEDAAAA